MLLRKERMKSWLNVNFLRRNNVSPRYPVPFYTFITFMTQLTLANESREKAAVFIAKQVTDGFLSLQADGSYKYYPDRKPVGAP